MRVGSNVDQLQVGDHIMALGNHGIQNVINLDTKDTIKIPDSLSLEEAACSALAFSAALHALELADLTAKQNLLIYSTDSPVGLAAVQIALLKGAEVHMARWCMHSY